MFNTVHLDDAVTVGVMHELKHHPCARIKTLIACDIIKFRPLGSISAHIMLHVIYNTVTSYSFDLVGVQQISTFVTSEVDSSSFVNKTSAKPKGSFAGVVANASTDLTDV